MNKEKFNLNDFYMEQILNDEVMVSLESVSPVYNLNKLLLTFVTSHNEGTSDNANKSIWEDVWKSSNLAGEYYLTKEEIFKLSDLLMEFRQKIEAGEKFLEMKKEVNNE